MKKLLLLPVVLVAISSCTKQADAPLAVKKEDNSGYDVNKLFTMSCKEDSTLLNDEGKYKTYVTLFDASNKYSVSLSVSSDDKKVFDEEIRNIRQHLRIEVLYSKIEKAADNREEPVATGIPETVTASKNITCIVTATNLPKDAAGFSFSFDAPAALTNYAPPEEGPINPNHGYQYGVYYMTLANGLVTFNHGPQNIYVVREYKKNWLSTWSSWGNTTLVPGTNDNYCIKDKNRIRVRVYFNGGTSQTCGAYGSPSC
ncbi:hypothetical protein [Taibaiella chishuiensis]|uniref:Uncharacterized protein n=1 Tax=Taibaiella chishuiensis TaxID=1434707 RepID=A0A2P8D4U8_9BACT|nr:hypothetical protein [Taibaiella chishuiensis]PSK92240.1 hypothetical protein B0I18_104339 [Taibaiella chishuiensis]